jgi:acetoacetate decarboxylase
MSYPAAPWQLFGTAVNASYLIDTEIAQQYVPPDLAIVSVLPGKTLANIYLSKYEAPSTLHYHELIVSPAVVKFQGKVGSWISHIYVDDLDSVAGGRNIWGLPKEMAEFTWSDRDISVSQGDRSLCRAEIGSGGLPLSPFGKSKIGGEVFGGLEREVLLFKGEFAAQLKWVGFQLEIGAASPFSSLKLSRPLVALHFRDLQFTANEATVIGRSNGNLRTLDRELVS